MTKQIEKLKRDLESTVEDTLSAFINEIDELEEANRNLENRVAELEEEVLKLQNENL